MKHLTNLTALTVLVSLTVVGIGHSENDAPEDRERMFFTRFVALVHAFAPAIADLYADEARIVSVRKYPNGTERTLEMRGAEYKRLLHEVMWIARARGYQPRKVQFAAVQPGRLGVTEQPGRRGTIEQSSRPSEDPDHVAREPVPPSGRLRPIIVEAMLNRKVSVSLMLDTGASYTVLTRQTAQDLGITGLERLPKQRFLTPGGPILSPVTTLKSIRVGTVEAQNVAVAIDVEGHLPLGLLGMTFMRHFKVTVDQVQGQAKFERR